jgi:ubiquinone/menaquinone biosynthesis C-methylase UbiE
MTRTVLDARAHEAEVNARFDLLNARFKHAVPADDVRLAALRRCLGPLSGQRILDLGCGKGRFASRLEQEGARVVGLDRSAAMLAGAERLDRIRASARRLPFGHAAFDAVIAVEVFEHLAGVDVVLEEIRRVLRRGGLLAVVDKNAGSWNAQRPWLPNLLIKYVDQKRGRWMYPSAGPVRERWFWPALFRRTLARLFEHASVEYLLSPNEESCALFRRLPWTRLLTLWTARAPGGDRP